MQLSIRRDYFFKTLYLLTVLKNVKHMADIVDTAVSAGSFNTLCGSQGG